jgi:hypothetical protein
MPKKVQQLSALAAADFNKRINLAGAEAQPSIWFFAAWLKPCPCYKARIFTHRIE